MNEARPEMPKLDVALERIVDRARQWAQRTPPNREIDGLDFEAIKAVADALSSIDSLRDDPTVLHTRLEELVLLLPEPEIDTQEVDREALVLSHVLDRLRAAVLEGINEANIAAAATVEPAPADLQIHPEGQAGVRDQLELLRRQMAATSADIVQLKVGMKILVDAEDNKTGVSVSFGPVQLELEALSKGAQLVADTIDEAVLLPGLELLRGRLNDLRTAALHVFRLVDQERDAFGGAIVQLFRKLALDTSEAFLTSLRALRYAIGGPTDLERSIDWNAEFGNALRGIPKSPTRTIVHNEKVLQPYLRLSAAVEAAANAHAVEPGPILDRLSSLQAQKLIRGADYREAVAMLNDLKHRADGLAGTNLPMLAESRVSSLVRIFEATAREDGNG